MGFGMVCAIHTFINPDLTSSSPRFFSTAKKPRVANGGDVVGSGITVMDFTHKAQLFKEKEREKKEREREREREIEAVLCQ